MTHQDPIDQLRQALAIAPSPEFAARVRQQVSSQPTRAAWWSVLHLVAAAAAVGVVSLAVARWGGPGPAGAPDIQYESASVSAVPMVESVTAAPSPAAPPDATITVVTRPRTSPIVVVATADVFAETLVPDDQRLALDRLLGAIRAGRATVPGVVAEEIVDEEGRRMPRALVIEPLKLELLAGTPAEPNKDPIKDSIK